MNKDTRAFLALSQADLDAALGALIQFKRRQDRVEHPDGSFDNAGRFYPSDEEDCGVTSRVRSPSRNWPNSYMLACRSLDHCEDLNGASHDAVLLVKRLLKKTDMDITGDPDNEAQIRVRLLSMCRQAQGEAKVPTARRQRMRS